MLHSRDGIVKGIFVTGTDTGVGKTVVSALIIRGLIKKGLRVGAMKPVETGCLDDPGAPVTRHWSQDKRLLIPRDGLFLKKASAMDDPLDLITPVRFARPLAPLVAAELEGGRVDVPLVKDAFSILSSRYDFMVVEGIGGLLVPLCRNEGRGYVAGESIYSVMDLARDLRLPMVIVTRPTLGTLNHTLLTLQVAADAGVKVLGICVNHTAAASSEDLAERTNPRVLAQICGVPILGNVPYLSELSFDALDKAAASIDIPVIPPYTEVLQ